MAYLLETLRSQKVTSVMGRKLGLDKDVFLVGPKELRRQVEDITTTAGSSYSPFGMTRILTSGSSQTGLDTLQAPVIGVQKRIWLMSTSTGCMLVKASGGAIFLGASLTTVGSTVLNFLGQNAAITLEAVSSAAWMMVRSFSSFTSSDHLRMSFTTST